MPVPPQRRIALAGGGTAGHVYPAIAVAQAYRDLDPQVELLFIGTRAGTEARLVTACGYHFAAIPGAPVYGVGAAGKLRALPALVGSIGRARRLLQSERMQVVIGFGGYASAGAVLAARSLGLPCAIHEPNAFPGLTNRALGRVANRVYVGFGSARSGLARSDALLTGIPVRAEILRVGVARGKLDLGARPRRVLVTGGSLGSAFLNQHAPAALALLGARNGGLEVRHQTGPHQGAHVEASYRQAGIEAWVAPYLDDIAAAYAWADAAIVCGGAITLAELTAAALPALIVPLARAARDHQRPNALAFAEASGLPCLLEQDWSDESAATSLSRLLELGASERLRALAPIEAARILVRDCEEMLAAHGSDAAPH